MVLCKYFQQGNCRYGQYCKFEHSYGNRSKNFNEDKNIALLVAEEILQAEKGGQWLLSCYGPFKEKKCIPGMYDVSPEEVRWEMYQAQKNGTADQVNAQFQQMCEQIKVKYEALKNPTPAIYQMLEGIQNSGSDIANKGSFAFGSSQLGTTNTNHSSNLFGQKMTFATTSNNPFGSTNSYTTPQQKASIFGQSSSTPSTNVFGGKASFGSTSVFGGTSTVGNSIFGSANKSVTTPFGTVQNTNTFGGLAAQGTSMFGGSNTNQTAFGQPPAFGANSQISNPLFNTQSSQSVFGGTTATGGNVFGGAATSTATNSVFGVQASVPAVSNTQMGSNLFVQTTTAAPAFGTGSVFGGTSTFGTQNAAGGSLFGGQSTFGQVSTAPATTNVFGSTPTNAFGATVSASPFGTSASTVIASNTSPFGTAPSAAVAQNATPFGATTSTVVAANASPFGAPTSTAVAANASPFGATTPSAVAQNASPFGATTPSAVAQNASPFGATTSTAVAANASPFGAVTSTALSNSSPFGVVTSTGVAPNASPFGTAPSMAAAGPFGATTANPIFGTSSPAVPSLMGGIFPAGPNTTSVSNVFGTTTASSTAQAAFGGSPFSGTKSSTNVFGTTTTVQQNGNPFLAQANNSPFGATSSTQSSPFGNASIASSGNAFGVSVNVTIDEMAYTPHECLTDDEKATYKMSEFILGQIPFNPPSKELA